jgi:hypothetical protein
MSASPPRLQFVKVSEAGTFPFLVILIHSDFIMIPGTIASWILINIIAPTTRDSLFHQLSTYPQRRCAARAICLHPASCWYSSHFQTLGWSKSSTYLSRSLHRQLSFAGLVTKSESPVLPLRKPSQLRNDLLGLTMLAPSSQEAIRDPYISLWPKPT